MDCQGGSSGISSQIALLRSPDPDCRNLAWQDWLESKDGRAFQRAVNSIAAKHGFHQTAEDIFQDTVLALFVSVRNGHFEIDRPSNNHHPLLSFAIGIAWKTVGTYLRRIYQEPKDLVYLDEEDLKTGEAKAANLKDQESLGLWQVAEYRQQIRCALKGLNDEEMRILKMDAEGMTDVEIAGALGVKRGTIRIRLYRIRIKVMRNLNSGGWLAD